MLPPKCPTCRMLLADKQIPYQKMVKELETKNLSDEKFSAEIRKILDDFSLTRYCCRVRMITFVDHTDVVV
jgi:DNA-directed RNA polymerase subunit N (RpoN/RPB10)